VSNDNPYGERTTKRKQAGTQPVCRICMRPIWPHMAAVGKWIMLDKNGQPHECRLKGRTG
jgi:hypothetical protein